MKTIFFCCKIENVKSYIKIFFIFIATFLTFCANPQVDDVAYQPSSNYIQNDYQKVVLVSNSIRGGEIVASETDTPFQLGGNGNAYLTNSLKTINLQKNTSLTQGSFIHNLSTNIKNEIFIRAP